MQELTRWRGEVFRFLFFFFFEPSVFCAFSRNLTVAGGVLMFYDGFASSMRFMFCHSGGWRLESGQTTSFVRGFSRLRTDLVR